MTSSTGTVVFNDAKLQAIDVVATERLGVGTLDPASNLHVVGNVHVTGNVNKLNFTDWVHHQARCECHGVRHDGCDPGNHGAARAGVRGFEKVSGGEYA